MELSPSLLDPGKAFIARVAGFLPSLPATRLVLLPGWLLAGFSRLLIFRLVPAIRFDLTPEQAGIDDVLARAESRQSPADPLAVLVRWTMKSS